MTTNANQTEKTDAAKPSHEVAAISRLVRDITSVFQSRGEFKVDRHEIDGELIVRIVENNVEVKREDDDPTCVCVIVPFSFEATKADDSADRVVYVAAEYEIEYRVDTRGSEFSEAAWDAFGSINARFNATPYWREFLHSSLTRSGLPPYLLPPFDAAERIRQLDSEQADKSRPPDTPTE